MSDDLRNPKIPQFVCFVCGAPTTMKCSQCKNAYYCSADHSKKGWKSHKKECKEQSESNTELQTYDAILFAANETQPRMVKIPWKWTSTEWEPEPLAKLIYPQWPRSITPFYIDCLYPGGPPLKDGRCIVTFHNDNFCNDGSPLNQAIQNVTNRQASHGWADHIVALRMKNPLDRSFQSAVLEEDLPVLAEYWKRY
ncbi:hypothetical protein FRB99_004894 [Tulasnella sp. 403]|nr:hypothetical protein FRB99_004894 [Tulasnella sp. 403]